MIEKYIKTDLDKKLYDLMKNVWDNEHFISHPFICLKTDEQKQKMIEALEDGLDDTDKLSLLVLYIKRGIEY